MWYVCIRLNLVKEIGNDNKIDHRKVTKVTLPCMASKTSRHALI